MSWTVERLDRVIAGLGGVRVAPREAMRGSGPPAPRSEDHSRSMQLTSHGLGIDIECQCDLDEGVASPVTASGFVDVALAHLPAVHSSLDAARFEVRGDGPTVEPEFRGEIGQCPSRLVLAHGPIDLGLAQATQNRPPAWV